MRRLGQESPELLTNELPGSATRDWAARAERVKAPMGPRAKPGAPAAPIVFARGHGCNVWDPDGNRYVDLAAGFGSLLLGHAHPRVVGAVETQSRQLLQAMGDVVDSDVKIQLLERLAELWPGGGAQIILGLSGADAVSAALKTAVLATGRSKVIAFQGGYHGLSYGPLAACGLRESYRAPFASQLNPGVTFLPFPDNATALAELAAELARDEYGGVIIEPILGRGGVRVLGSGELARVSQLAQAQSALLIADEIWTGLGRSGSALWSFDHGVTPDLVCLGKGLGGGLPISACLGSAELMRCWSQEQEVVHTSTFAGAALGCAAALATLDVLDEAELVARSRGVGAQWKEQLAAALTPFDVEVRGVGLMIGIELKQAGAAVRAAQGLLRRGFIVSTGGGARDSLILTPPLTIERALCEAFTACVAAVLEKELAS